MSSSRASIESAFVAAFPPEPFLKNFFDDVIDFFEPSASSITETSMTVFRKRLNGMLKIYRKKMTSVGEEENGKEVTKASRIALSGLFVLLAFEKARRAGSGVIMSLDEFREAYPNFAGVEEQTLLAFRNYMAVSLTLEEAKNNKAFHMEISARLSQGSDAKYITGSGQSSATSRRVHIYEKEGNVTPVTGRRQREVESDLDGYASESSTSSKRSRASVDSVSTDGDLASTFVELFPYTAEEPSMLEPDGDALEYLESSVSTATNAALDVADFEVDFLDEFDEDML